MKTPKNQKELLKIIEEQEKQIKSLKQAVLRLEQVVRNVSIKSNQTQGNHRRLAEQVRTLNSSIHRILKG